MSDQLDAPDEATSPSVVFSTFEQALKVVGSFGPYQITYLLVLQVAIVVFCGNVVFAPYSTYNPTVTCYYNDTFAQLFPDENKTQEERFCLVYERKECQNLTFDAPFNTIIEEWQLICSKQYVAGLVNTIAVCGTILSVVVGYFSDRFGRKTVYFITYSAMIVSSFGSSFAPNWIAFAAARFVVGLFVTASYTVIYVWAMEMTDRKHNFITNVSSLWHFGFMATALIGYLTRDYKLYLIVLNCIGAPLVVAFALYFIESPRWLIQQGRLDTAAKSLNRIGNRNRKKNRVQISAEHLSGIPQNEENTNAKANFLKLLTTPVLRKFLLTLCLVTFATSTMGSAFIFKVSFLAGNPFLKFFLYGLFRIVTPILLYIANTKISWFGRRHIINWTLLAVLFFYGLAILVGFLNSHSQFLFWLLVVGAIVGNSLWAGLGQYSMELFPTHLRSTAASAMNVIDPIASAIIPQLLYLEAKFSIPGISLIWAEMCASFALIVSYWVLPETKGRPLPDTIEAVQGLSEEHGKIKRWHDNWLYCKAVCCGLCRKQMIENVENVPEDGSQAEADPN